MLWYSNVGEGCRNTMWRFVRPKAYTENGKRNTKGETEMRKHGRGSTGQGVVIVCVLLAAAALGIYSRSSAAHSLLEEWGEQRESLHFGRARSQNVSENTSEYIQAQKTVSVQIGQVMELACDELSAAEDNVYDSCSEEIHDLLRYISAAEDLHIASASPLAEFETYCSTYYGYVADFFTDVRQSQTFSREDYTILAEWMNETKTPYDKLKELFEKNGITYSLKNRSDGSEYIEYSISPHGVY